MSSTRRILTAATITATLLTVAACGQHTDTAASASQPADTATTAPATPAANTDAQTWTTDRPSPSNCTGTSYRLVADQWCLYPASVTWIDDTTILPTQPDRIDWTDPDQVAAAYVTTSLTWDTKIDPSSASALHRAAIYTSTNDRAPDTSDPATAHGQADYLTAREHGATSTVTIDRLYTEGYPPEPHQPDGTWARAIDYTHTITYHDHTPSTVRTGTTWITLAKTADGTWRTIRATQGAETATR